MSYSKSQTKSLIEKIASVATGKAKERILNAKAEHFALNSNVERRNEAITWIKSQKDLAEGDLIIVFGAGQGAHLSILKEVGFQKILVIEPDPSRIRFLIEEDLLVDGIEISDDPMRAQAWTATRMTAGVRAKLLIGLEVQAQHQDALQKTYQALESAITQSSITLATLEKRFSVWVEHSIKNLKAIENTVPAIALKDWLGDRPVIIVSAGPSLEKNVHHLKEVQGRSAIFAVNTALGALECAGIRADLVIALEALDISEQLEGLTINKDIPRVLALSSNPAHFKTRAPIYPFIESFECYQEMAHSVGVSPQIPSGGSVANSAFSFARVLGAKEIILIGQDLAYPEGKVYAAGTVFDQMRIDIDDKDNGSFKNIDAKKRIAESRPEVAEHYEKGKLVKTIAYGGKGDVFTTGAFNYFRQMFEHWAEQAESTLKLINATEGGAQIQGFEEIPLKDVIDGLTPHQTQDMPTEPKIEAQAIKRYFAKEKKDIQNAINASTKLLEHETKETIETFRQSMHQSSLLQAYTWRSFYSSLSQKELTIEELAKKVKDEARALLGFM